MIPLTDEPQAYTITAVWTGIHPESNIARGRITSAGMLAMWQAEELVGKRLAAYLDDTEREAMRRDIAAALMAAEGTGRWAAYQDALDAWRATAEVLADPDLAAELLAEADPVEEVSLRRP